MSRYSPSDEGEVSPVSVEPYSKERRLTHRDGDDMDAEGMDRDESISTRKHHRRSKDKSKRKHKNKSHTNSHHKRNHHHHHPPEEELVRGRFLCMCPACATS